MAERIADASSSLTAELHDGVLAGDNKIWLFSRTYHAQPTHNWGHRVVFPSGYAIAFDLKENQWSDKIVYEADHNEDLDELLFTDSNGRIFLLLHTAFGAIDFPELREWKDGKWNALKLEVSDDLKTGAETDGGRIDTILVDGFGPSKAPTFIVSGGALDSPRLVAVNVAEDSAKLENLGELKDVGQRQVSHDPVRAALHDGQLEIIGGAQGCGFRWHPRTLSRFELPISTKKDDVQTSGDAPPFAFRGSHAAGIFKNGTQWIHATGSRAVGMTDSKFDGSIYALDLESKDAPNWSKIGELPAEIADDSHFDLRVIPAPQRQALYVVHREQGVYRIPI